MKRAVSFGLARSKNEPVIVIDLGRRTVKAVRLSGGASSLEEQRIDIPSEISADPAVRLKHALTELKGSLTGKCRTLVVSLSPSDVRMTLSELPGADLLDAPAFIRRNSTIIFQEALADHTFDYVFCSNADQGQEKGRPPSKSKALICGAPSNIVAQLHETARAAGYKLQRVVPGPAASFNHLLATRNSEQPITLIDIGSQQTTLSILQGNDVRLTRIIPVGGHHLTAALAEIHKVPLSVAEGIKHMMPGKAEAILRPVLRGLITEISLSLAYFESNNDHLIDTVFVTGASTQCPQIFSWLSEDLHRTVERWDPSVNGRSIDLQNKSETTEAASGTYDCAMAIARSCLSPGPFSLDLLREQHAAVDARTRDPFRQTLVYCSAFIALLLCFGIYEGFRFNAADQELAAIRAEELRLGSESQLVRSNFQRFGEVRTMLNTLHAQSERRFLFSTCLDALQRVPLHDLSLTRLKLKEDIVTSPLITTTNKSGKLISVPSAPPFQRNTLVIEARQRGDAASVERFIKAVKSDKWFASTLRAADPIRLKNVVERKSETEQETLYTVEAYAETNLQ